MRLLRYRDLAIVSRFSAHTSPARTHSSLNRPRLLMPTRRRPRDSQRHAKRLLGVRPVRTIICQAIILNLLIWPTPAVTFRPILDPVSVLASTVSSTMSGAGSALSQFAASVVFIPAGPLILPLPVLPI